MPEPSDDFCEVLVAEDGSEDLEQEQFEADRYFDEEQARPAFSGRPQQFALLLSPAFSQSVPLFTVDQPKRSRRQGRDVVVG